MTHRKFRLSVSPEDVPEVRRVIELDGRSSLAELHGAIRSLYAPGAREALYGFFLSGRFWDAATAYLDPRADSRRADKALLFRLNLQVGKSFAYLLGFKDERRFVVTVVAIDEVTEPLTAPIVIETVGDAPAEAPPVEAPAPEQDPPELGDLVKIAEAFLDLDDKLDPFADALSSARAASQPWEDEDAALGERDANPGHDPAAAVALNEAAPLFVDTAVAASELLRALHGDAVRFLKLDEWLLSRALGPRLLDLPMNLAFAGVIEPALSLARDMVFIDPELVKGDIAIILARAGEREQALAQVEQNLDGARDAALVEAKAGDTYRVLGDLPAAEAYYRRSLSVAKSSSDRLHALLRLVTCLTDSGRDAEAAELLKQARKERGEPDSKPSVTVGRNEACPCGSGKKYKKCHGAIAN